MNRKTLADYSPAMQAQIVAGLHPGSTPMTTTLRQRTKGPNKLEAAFAAYLRGYNPGAVIHEQAVTLLVANGVRYTPDIFSPGTLSFYETKGFMRDDAAVKIKVAAGVHPWATFYLVTKIKASKGGGWNIQRILP